MLYPWQESQWLNINQQIQQKRLAHALMLTGVSGLGKLDLANHISEAVLCENSDGQDASCGHCHSCRLFRAGNHPDHTFIEPEETGKQIKIGQIRQLKDKQELTPTVSKWKTVIIYPAHSMNINANNSLLKLLEEPPENTLLILISSQPEKLPITILSRCQRINLSSPSSHDSINWLKQQGLPLEQSETSLLLELSKGAPLAMVKIMESDLMSKLKQLDNDFDSLLKGDANPVPLTKQWLDYDLLVILNYLQNTIKSRLIQMQEQDDSADITQYWTIYDCIIAAIKLTSSSNNINKTLLIEQFMVSVMDRNPNNISALNN